MQPPQSQPVLLGLKLRRVVRGAKEMVDLTDSRFADCLAKLPSGAIASRENDGC